MTNAPSPAGQQLLALLPEVYRHRDRDAHHLAAYLDACGELLDLIRATLDQRLADCFPDSPPEGLASQPWLLPYFAELVDARLLSPHTAGRRAEVSQAVAWRQRKGTARVALGIAEAVAQLDIEVQEGWQRLATTPRIGLALPTPPPPVTVDVRRPSRAVATHSAHPDVQGSRPGATPVYWRQAHAVGAPCFPGSYEDASRRTVDLRDPTFQAGHYHPRRLLLFTPPSTGFFPLPVLTFPLAVDASPRQVRMTWAERAAPGGDKYVQETGLTEPGAVHHIFNPSRVEGAEGGPVAVTVTTSPLPFGAAVGGTGLTAPGPLDVLRIEDVNFLGTLTVNSGRVELRRVAAKKLIILPIDGEEPVIDAVDCLFEIIEVKNPVHPAGLAGLVRLEHCTVLTSLRCQRLQASDCLFTCSIELTGPATPASCARYSRLPPDLSPDVELRLQKVATTTDEPVFHHFAHCAGGGLQLPASFGDPGCGVLHPATPDSICFGGENSAEMGAYHHLGYCARHAAVCKKVDEFLPVGIEAVLIPDARLLTAPVSELLTPQG